MRMSRSSSPSRDFGDHDAPIFSAGFAVIAGHQYSATVSKGSMVAEMPMR